MKQDIRSIFITRLTHQSLKALLCGFCNSGSDLMTYKNKRILLLTSAICLVVLILSFFANRDDRFLGDYNPLLYGTLMIYNVIINFVLSSNEVSTNAAKRLLSIGKWSMPLFSLTYFFLSYTPATFPHVFDTEVFCSTFVGAILIIVGNYFPKNRRNRFVGLKFPWLFSDEEGWRKTHQLGAYTWILAGIVMLIHPLHRMAHITTLLALLLAIGVPMFYSLSVHFKK